MGENVKDRQGLTHQIDEMPGRYTFGVTKCGLSFTWLDDFESMVYGGVLTMDVPTCLKCIV